MHVHSQRRRIQDCAVEYRHGKCRNKKNRTVRTYASPVKHEVSRLAFAKTPKYRETAASSHEGEKVEEFDRSFGDHKVIRCGHPKPFVCDRRLPQG